MTEEAKTFTFKVEDIFEDIEGDEENVLMNIPPEIMEAQGWKEGDNLKIEWGDQGSIVISKVEESNE
jgi:formylmethanofuran dehydrogenase subunit D